MTVDFSNLPDSMESYELEEYFREFIAQYCGIPATKDTLKQLYELAYRQWDTYESLDEDIAQEIEEYLIKAVNFSSYGTMDTILSIVENLSLKDAFTYITDNKDRCVDLTVRRLIEEAEEEYADSIGDPFELD